MGDLILNGILSKQLVERHFSDFSLSLKWRQLELHKYFEIHRRVKLPLIMGWMAKNIPSRMNPFVSNNETKYSLNVSSEQITTHTFVARIGHKAVKLFPGECNGLVEWPKLETAALHKCFECSNVSQRILQTLNCCFLRNIHCASST